MPNLEKYPSLPQLENFSQTREKATLIPFDPEKISPPLLEIKNQLEAISSTWNPVELLTPNPISVMQEMDKFMAAFSVNMEYNPVFDYDIALSMDVDCPHIEIEKLLTEVRKYHPQNPQEKLFRVALYFKLRDDQATCLIVKGIQNHDEKLLKEAFGRKYPSLDTQLLVAAESIREIITDSPPTESASGEAILSKHQQKLLKETEFNAEQIKEAFEWVLQKYGILKTNGNEGFAVEISDRALAVDVRDKSESPMTIYIPTQKTTTGDSLLDLIAHEIEGHARQSMNGDKLFGLGGGRLKIDDETLYEGLAMKYGINIRSKLFGETGKTPLPWASLAVSMAERGASFSEIFNEIFQLRLHADLHISITQQIDVGNPEYAKEIKEAAHKAWATTYRIMRGHVDMTNPEAFAMSKDLGYLRGWLLDKQLMEAGYDEINQMGIIQLGGLQLLARLDTDMIDLPYPFQDFTTDYCMDVLLPQLTQRFSS